MPTWNVPTDLLAKLEAEGEEAWESSEWDPILIMAARFTRNEAGDVPLSWTVLFEPSDERLSRANAKLETLGLDADGYGWETYITQVVSDEHPEFAEQLSWDSELSTCVANAESESACRALVELLWGLLALDVADGA